MSELGKLLKELRTAKGLSIRGAAGQLGLSYSRLSDFERGTTHNGKYASTPDRDVLRKMSAVYSYPLPTLLALVGLPETEPQLSPIPDEVEIGAQELAQIYRELPKQDQRMFLQLARTYRTEALKRMGELP